MERDYREGERASSEFARGTHSDVLLKKNKAHSENERGEEVI